MKRTAEKQLSKDDGEDEEIQEIPHAQGFRKADESVLAGRPIKGLPRRAAAGATTTQPASAVNGTTVPDNSTPARFGGFAGFGQPTNNTTGFQFSMSPSTPAVPSFSSPSSFTGNADSPLESPPPPVSTNATSAAKSLASFLSPSSALLASDDRHSEPALKYYCALRGLNISFLKAITDAVDRDPFADATQLLDGYKSFRGGIQKDYDETQKKSNSIFGSSGAPSKPSPPMPAPPTAGFGGGASTPSSKIAPAASGFTSSSSAVPSESGFTLNPASVSNSTSTPNPLVFGENSSSTSSTSTTRPPSIFPSDGISKPESQKADSPFSSNRNGKSPSTFDSNSSAPDRAQDSSTTNLFGTHSQRPVFGTDKNPFAVTTSSTDKNPFIVSNPSSFGTVSSPPTSAFGSGSGSPKLGSFASFGKPGGSLGNPVGFGFGSPPKTPEISSSEKDKTGFVFGSASGSGSTSNADDGVVNEEASKMLMTPSVHDEEGEGEEGEETTHSVRVKVFKLLKDEKESKWVDYGLGLLKLKKHKETHSRRALLRNSGTGKITLNFKIYPGLTPSLSSRVVSLVGHDEGVSQPYRLRMKTEEQATELKSALDREIAAVKSN